MYIEGHRCVTQNIGNRLLQLSALQLQRPPVVRACETAAASTERRLLGASSLQLCVFHSPFGHPPPRRSLGGREAMILVKTMCSGQYLILLISF